MKPILLIGAIVAAITLAILCWPLGHQALRDSPKLDSPVSGVVHAASKAHTHAVCDSVVDNVHLGISTQLSERTRAFDAALMSTLCTLQPNLTNITDEEIARIYSGLKDPTLIVDVIDPYMRGQTRSARGVAKRFFEYMLSHYKEERLQACGHQRLAMLSSRDALYEGSFDTVSFQQSIAHSEAVINMPSKTYWYYIALDDLGTHYMIAGNMTGRYYEYHGKAYSYFKRLYEEGDKAFMKENALCFMLRCLNTKQEKRAFYHAHKNELRLPEWQADFDEQATYEDLK